jgi:hypothetical protein
MSTIVLKGDKLAVINSRGCTILDDKYMGRLVCHCERWNYTYYAVDNIIYDENDEVMFEFGSTIKKMYLLSDSIYCVTMNDDIYECKDIPTLLPFKAEPNFYVNTYYMCNGTLLWCMPDKILIKEMGKDCILNIQSCLAHEIMEKFTENIKRCEWSICIRLDEYKFTPLYHIPIEDLEFVDANGECALVLYKGVKHIVVYEMQQVDDDVTLYKPIIRCEQVKSARNI